MRAVVVVPPDPVVSWEEADDHLRLNGDTSQQPYVEALIASATALIDGPNGYLNRALGVQTIEARFDRFWDYCTQPRIILPCRPIIEIVGIQYLGLDGTTVVMDPAGYALAGAELILASALPWPATFAQREAVRVSYTAGYETIPAPIRAAILLMVGDLYDNRSTTLDARANAAVEVPMSTKVERLLAPYGVWS